MLRAVSENAGQVIAPHPAQWAEMQNRTRRERLGADRFKQACRAHHRGAYQKCVRFLTPLLESSPQSTRLAHYIEVCWAKITDPATPTLRTPGTKRARRDLFDTDFAEGDFMEAAE